VIYANEPDIIDGCDGDDPVTADTSPNQDLAADTQIGTVAHELFESVTDPATGGYVAASGDEIGDLCVK